jgi:hypothetical protein
MDQKIREMIYDLGHNDIISFEPIGAYVKHCVFQSVYL